MHVTVYFSVEVCRQTDGRKSLTKEVMSVRLELKVVERTGDTALGESPKPARICCPENMIRSELSGVRKP